MGVNMANQYTQPISEGLAALLAGFKAREDAAKSGLLFAKDRYATDLEMEKLKEEQRYKEGLRGILGRQVEDYKKDPNAPEMLNQSEFNVWNPDVEAPSAPMEPRGLKSYVPDPTRFQAGAEYSAGLGRFKEAEAIRGLQPETSYTPSIDPMEFYGKKAIVVRNSKGEAKIEWVPDNSGKGRFVEHPPKVIQGVTLIPKENLDTGEISYTQVSRPPKESGVGGSGDDKGLSLPETDALTDALQVKKKAGRLKSGFSSAYIPRVGKLTASDTLADVENKIMATTGNNPQASAWWRDFWDTFNSEAYKKSGKAISEAEMKRLLKAWATGSSDPKVMQDFIGVKEAEIDEYYRSRKAGISTGKRKAVETWEKEIAPKTDPLGIL